MNTDPQDEITRLRLELHHAYIRINGFEKNYKRDDSGHNDTDSHMLWIEMGNAKEKIKSLQFSINCLAMSGFSFVILVAIYIFTRP
jgi:hypothetical protein